MLADKCLELLEINKSETGGGGYGVISSRAKAVKGLVELVHGNLESGTADCLPHFCYLSCRCFSMYNY